MHVNDGKYQLQFSGHINIFRSIAVSKSDLTPSHTTGAMVLAKSKNAVGLGNSLMNDR